MTTTREPRAIGRRARWFNRIPQATAPYLAFGALLGLSAAIAPGVLQPSSLASTFSFAVLLGVAALGQTIVILHGGIDLSVPNTIAVSALMFLTVYDTAGFALAVLAALAAGITVGVINGLAIAYLEISPIVTTIAVNGLLLGLALIYFNISQLTQIPDSIKAITSARIDLIGVQVPAVIPVGLLLIIGVELLLRYSGWGSMLRFLGSSRLAAVDAGLPVRRLRISAYAVGGAFNAAAGLLTMGVFGQASIGMGDSYLLSTVAAVLIGGATVAGGKGTAIGTLGGALVLTQVQVLVLNLGIDSNGQQIVTGLVVVIVAIAYARGNKK